MKINKKFWMMIGTFNLFGTLLLMIYTFMLAFFSNDKVVKVYVDLYHEANVEFFLCIPYLFATGLFVLIHSIKEYQND